MYLLCALTLVLRHSRRLTFNPRIEGETMVSYRILVQELQLPPPTILILLLGIIKLFHRLFQYQHLLIV